MSAALSKASLTAIVPYSNDAVELELSALLPDERVAITRLPQAPDSSLRERLNSYLEAYPVICGGLAGKGQTIYVACTGTSYVAGATGEAALTRDLMSVTGSTVLQATEAIHAVLEMVPRPILTIISPYPPWLTEAAVDYWVGLGIRVETAISLEARGGAIDDPRSDEARIIHALEGMRLRRSSVVLLSGTGMRTLRPMASIRKRSPHIAVVSANVCASYVIARQRGRVATAGALALEAMGVRASL